MTTKQIKTRLDSLHSQGFDSSTYNKEFRHLHVLCSQCAAVVINGVPCHETGCPNEMHECNGCNEPVGRNVRYCAECAGF